MEAIWCLISSAENDGLQARTELRQWQRWVTDGLSVIYFPLAFWTDLVTTQCSSKVSLLYIGCNKHDLTSPLLRELQYSHVLHRTHQRLDALMLHCRDKTAPHRRQKIYNGRPTMTYQVAYSQHHLVSRLCHVRLVIALPVLTHHGRHGNDLPADVISASPLPVFNERLKAFNSAPVEPVV